VKILAVVVIYQRSLSESHTLKGLCEAFSIAPNLAENYSVMIWDNSPHAIENPQLPIPFVYEHSGDNLGVSGAYNRAMQYALESKYPWLLLLDQDTLVTSDYLIAMYRHSLNLLSSIEIAAIAPTVRAGQTIISPAQRRIRPRPYPSGESGIALGELLAINSGCILRVASLQKIGGFSAEFWLDFSDYYVFHQFFMNNMKVWRAADAKIAHNLSVFDYEHSMTPLRYKNICYAETAFIDIYNSWIDSVVYSFRLFARAIKQWMKHDNPEFSYITWEQLMYRLRVRKAERIARWVTTGKERKTKGTV
jgi:glycosyltransferase involved in cell wall biosynthesis